VILIDQLKKICIDAELDVVDTTIWHRKVTKGDYSVGLNLTGLAVDDPMSISSRTTPAILSATTTILQSGGRATHSPAIQGAGSGETQGYRLADRAKTGGRCARPVIHFQRAATCWYLCAGARAAPEQHLQRRAVRGRLARK
jgi:hypothetical protein